MTEALDDLHLGDSDLFVAPAEGVSVEDARQYRDLADKALALLELLHK